MNFKNLKLSSFFKKDLSLLYLIILIGSYLRLQGVFTNSFAFTYDVGRDMLALWDIVYLHKITLIGATTGLPGVFYGPWWYFMLTPFFLIFSGNPQGIAFMMSLIGISSIIIAFMFGNKIQGSATGLIFAGLVSVSPVMVSLSSQIWNPNIAPLFVLLIFLCLYKIFSGEKRNRVLYFFFLGILLSLSIDIEIVYGIFLTIGTLMSLIFIARKTINKKDTIFLVLGLLLIAFPRIVFELRHGFLMTKSFISFITSGNSSKDFGNLFNIFLNRIEIIFNQFSSTLAVENKILGLAILVLIIFILIFLYKKENKILKDFIKTSLLVLGVFVLGTTFFSHDIWPHYLVGLPVFYIFLFSISLFMFGKRLNNYLIVSLIAAVVIIININPLNVYQGLSKPLWIGDASVYRNQLAVLDYIYRQAKEENFKYVAYTPPVYDYTYQYLFMWYGPYKYHYSPSVKSNLAFFILEPDLQYPSRLIDWLKIREGDGKIVKSEKLDSGIIVQTRLVR